MTQRAFYELSLTTQGPSYPPSEVMNADGDFIVIGRINRQPVGGTLVSAWGRAIVSRRSAVPQFGRNLPYDILRELPEQLGTEDEAMVLHTLPLPLPCNNYPVIFAPEQRAEAMHVTRPSHAFHGVPIPDLCAEDGRKLTEPVTLGQWCKARGHLEVSVAADQRSARFEFEFGGLLPDSLYTVMTLRRRNLDPVEPTRPGPLGIPNVFITDEEGCGRYAASLPNPFPTPASEGSNRVVNVVLLWMSYQMSHGGAIGHFGLGGDVHAQLKLRLPSFFELDTHA